MTEKSSSKASKAADSAATDAKALRAFGDPVRKTEGWQEKRKRHLVSRLGHNVGLRCFEKEQAEKFAIKVCAEHDRIPSRN